MTTDMASAGLLHETRSCAHPDCVVCSASNANGLGLAFALLGDGSVRASFDCAPALTGYPGCIQGGVTAALLDGAMTNCLFAHGHVAMTAELNIRYHLPLAVGAPAIVRAWIEKSRGPLHVMKAEVIQGETVKATATGKFMPRRS